MSSRARSWRLGAIAIVLAGACSRTPAHGGERGSGGGTGPGPADSATGRPGSGSAPAPAPVAAVTLATASGPTRVTVEVVRTPALLEKGLMYRRNMAEDHGMLFLMGEEKVHTFWMRNTLIPLDIMFIGRDLTIVGIGANAKPLDETPVGVGKPSLYVLEVNGGWAARHGVTAGSKVTFENVEAAAR